MSIPATFPLTQQPSGSPPILEIKELVQYFHLQSRRGTIFAVDNVSFAVSSGSTLGLVGESGSGKTSIAHAVLRITRPTSGQILFNGEDISNFSGDKLKHFRREVQMVFQDPYSSLDPHMSVGQIIEEPLQIHRMGTAYERARRVADLLRLVSLGSDMARQYPQQLSGGQRQRVAIARALALEPRLLICDEPVSALDVSVQAQILNLLKELKGRLTLSCLFISHDLAVVRFIADEIAVMYLGKIVEIGPKAEILQRSRHPYTRALLSAVPTGKSERRRTQILLRGEIPSAVNPPSGCRFHTRCPIATPICSREEPRLKQSDSSRSTVRHLAACHFSDEIAGRFDKLSAPESAVL